MGLVIPKKLYVVEAEDGGEEWLEYYDNLDDVPDDSVVHVFTYEKIVAVEVKTTRKVVDL